MTAEQNLVAATCEAVRLGWLALREGKQGIDALNHISNGIQAKFDTGLVFPGEIAINAYAYAVILRILDGDVE